MKCACFIRKAVMIGICFLLVLATGSAMASDIKLNNTGPVVRNLPSRHSGIIGHIGHDTAYTVTYEATNGWSILEFADGRRGAVLTKDLSILAAEKVAAGKARLVAAEKAKAQAAVKRNAAAANKARAAARAGPTQRRVALVIGNDRYDSLPSLHNAGMDARGMAAKLRGFGFEVILNRDAGRRDFHRAITAFRSKLRGADVGLVFYTGHGIQVDEENYLIPAGAQIEVKDDLRFEAIGTEEILRAMMDRGSRLTIVIIDACRDNPLPTRSRSTVRGLTITSVPAMPASIHGTAILYSAAPGQTVQDGPKGGHGIFTAALLEVIDRPGLNFEQVFKQTARRVSALTNYKQDPWINSSIKGDFVINPLAAAPSVAVPAPNLTGPSTNPLEQRSAELLFWKSIKDSHNPAAFKAYLEQYPDGPFVPLARLMLQDLEAVTELLRSASIAPTDLVFTTWLATLWNG